jgi:hypothetical protein
VFGVLEVILRHDPVPGKGFGAGQGQIALIVSLCVLSVPRLGAAGPEKFISPRGLGSSRHSVGHTLRIWAWGRRRRFKFRNVFHVGPYAAPAEAGRRSFEELSSCNATKVSAAARAAPGCGKLRSALDQEYRELAERIQIDWSHIGRQSRDFKLQLELAQPFFWLGVVTFTKRSNCLYYWFGPYLIDRVLQRRCLAYRFETTCQRRCSSSLKNSERCKMRVPRSWSETSREV